jgi:hypothetical protein
MWLDGPRGRVPALGVPSASASPDGRHDPAAYNLYHIGKSGSGWSCEAITRGFRAGGSDVVELSRRVLT